MFPFMTSHIHHLDDLLLFSEVVEKGGFSAAARILGLQRSKLSRRVADLEARLGLRLLQRNTRHISLTPMGEQIYVHARAMARGARPMTWRHRWATRPADCCASRRRRPWRSRCWAT